MLMTWQGPVNTQPRAVPWPCEVAACWTHGDHSTDLSGDTHTHRRDASARREICSNLTRLQRFFSIIIYNASLSQTSPGTAPFEAVTVITHVLPLYFGRYFHSRDLSTDLTPARFHEILGDISIAVSTHDVPFDAVKTSYAF